MGRRKLWGITFFVVLVTSVSGGAFYYFMHQNSHPISKEIRSSVSFPIYYPEKLPAGYAVDKESVKVEGGILFYVVSSTTKKITITQQTAPSSGLDLKKLSEINTSFKSNPVLAGEAVLGLNQGIPVGIMKTNTTLVNITGQKDIPQDVLARLMRDLSSLPN